MRPPLWHTLPVDAVAEALQTNLQKGLSHDEAARRLAEYGPNRLEAATGRTAWRILLGQFKETMVLILLAAAVISYLIGDLKDTLVILAIVVLNAALGFFQEYRAEKAIEALQKMAVPHVHVLRDGEWQEIEATNLVPGDVIRLEAGGAVPADARLVEAVNLQVQEAALTGESVPVDKQTDPLPDPETPIGDRRNMVYMGTAVTYGRGKAIVVATGMATELGKIAAMLQSVEEEQTPLQRRMDQLGKRLAAVAIVLVALVFVLGLWRGGEVAEMLLTAISLAVAAVPEGLPAVVTIALALGARRMVQRNALIRRLPAVETLGSVTVICSDKTGTLTENRMTVTVLDVANQRIDLQTERAHMLAETPPDALPPALQLMLIGGALCNDAELRRDHSQPDRYFTVGDPTEGALVMAAVQYHLLKPDLEAEMPRVGEVPFSSERKRMSTIHRLPAQHRLLPMLDTPFVLFTKGAVDVLLPLCTHVWNADRAEPLTDDWRARIETANTDMASQGQRVLGLAFRPLTALPEPLTAETVERELIFVGLFGMIDPPRPEAKDAVAKARQAGIRTVMITGDHALTAEAIARQLGIAETGTRTLTGRDLEQMSDEELIAIVEDVRVFARVSPEHKLRIVTALQAHRHNTAMTGDGVNDAPALKKADIGIAMGITGTDVAKEAADMILLDDNFATIVAAIEEGRTIYDNIRKFVRYLLTSNSGEIWVMLLAPLLGLPVPLLPLQILWINLVTDGLPALALGVEPPEKDVMKRPPYPPTESIFARGLWQHILWVGLLMGLLTLGVQIYALERHEAWQSMVFNTLAVAQMAHVMAIRSERESLFTLGLRSNPWMLGAVASTLVLQVLVLYWQPLQAIFETEPLTLGELVATWAVALVIFVAVEIEKWWRRRKEG